MVVTMLIYIIQKINSVVSEVIASMLIQFLYMIKLEKVILPQMLIFLGLLVKVNVVIYSHCIFLIKENIYLGGVLKIG